MDDKRSGDDAEIDVVRRYHATINTRDHATARAQWGDDGTRQRFRGTYVVRHVNGVDGATPAQPRGHLDSATLAPAW